jgi:hypothetical protein
MSGNLGVAEKKSARPIGVGRVAPRPLGGRWRVRPGPSNRRQDRIPLSQEPLLENYSLPHRLAYRDDGTIGVRRSGTDAPYPHSGRGATRPNWATFGKTVKLLVRKASVMREGRLSG